MAQKNILAPRGEGKIASNIRQLISYSQRQAQLRSHGVRTSQTTRGTTRSTQIRRPIQQVRQNPAVSTNVVARWS